MGGTGIMAFEKRKMSKARFPICRNTFYFSHKRRWWTKRFREPRAHSSGPAPPVVQMLPAPAQEEELDHWKRGRPSSGLVGYHQEQ